MWHSPQVWASQLSIDISLPEFTSWAWHSPRVWCEDRLSFVILFCNQTLETFWPMTLNRFLDSSWGSFGMYKWIDNIEQKHWIPFVFFSFSGLMFFFYLCDLLTWIYVSSPLCSGIRVQPLTNVYVDLIIFRFSLIMSFDSCLIAIQTC